MGLVSFGGFLLRALLAGSEEAGQNSRPPGCGSTAVLALARLNVSLKFALLQRDLARVPLCTGWQPVKLAGVWKTRVLGPLQWHPEKPPHG